MFRNNIKLAWRYLLKDRAFTLLNLLGLATGLACAIMIYCWVDDETHVDTFNQNNDRIVQILKNAPSPTGISTDDHTPGQLAATLASDLPEVSYATSVIPVSWFDKEGLLIYGNRRVTARSAFAGDNYFKIFSYHLLDGNADEVLKDKQSIVISDELAQKLFRTTENLVGATIEWNQKDYSGVYRISGVFEKPPANATAQFDIVFNYALFLDKNPKLNDWGNNDPSTYVLLKKDAAIDAFNGKIAGLVKARVQKSETTLWAQQYSDRYLHNRYENGVPEGGRITYVRIFSLIAAFILVIACINFMNLSTAKAAGRLKETSIKKAIGASRAGLIAQYMAESLILATLALIIALVLVFLLLPSFNQITNKHLTLHFTPTEALSIGTITLATGILAGCYPAFYLSGFKTALIGKNNIKTSLSELLVRKGLVLFQFTLSTVFILSVLVIYRQMRLIQTKNLGYNRENILYFERGGLVSTNKEDYAPGGKYESDLQNFLQRVKSIPGVVNVSNFRHNITNRNGGTYDISWPGKDPNQRIDFTDLDVGYDFVETAGITLQEGRTYSRNFGNEQANIIFNESAIRIMGLQNPIGKVIHLWGSDRTIIGVVKDFNFQSLYNPVKPCFLDLNTNHWASKIMVRVQAGAAIATIDKLKKLYQEFDSGGEFEYRFLDEDYQALYSGEIRVSALSKYFAGMAIIISCLGLFGLAAFTAQKRQREIGIRKVLGATVNGIVLLLSKDFLMLISLSLLIAFPLCCWGTNRWLHGFAYRADPGIGTYLLTGITIVGMALLSISFQSVKAACSNPVSSLR
jgi:putative ABC transport system permease protein